MNTDLKILKIYKDIDNVIKDYFTKIENDIVECIEKESDYANEFFINEINRLSQNIVNNIDENILENINSVYNSTIESIEEKFSSMLCIATERFCQEEKIFICEFRKLFFEKKHINYFDKRCDYYKNLCLNTIIEFIDVNKFYILDNAINSSIELIKYIDSLDLLEIIFGNTDIRNEKEFIKNNDFKSLKYLELNKLAEKHGFKFKRQSATSHAIYSNKDGKIVIIPQHKIGKGLQIKIMKNIGIWNLESKKE
ncbi:type II toxin-antitoxin system HicA family toxin [Clostridium perfringens]|nr:type II toxin-antitoxin system HicA family toxin [Clostridium perfringens]